MVLKIKRKEQKVDFYEAFLKSLYSMCEYDKKAKALLEIERTYKIINELKFDQKCRSLKPNL